MSDEDAIKYLTMAAASGDLKRILWSEKLVKRADFLWSIGGDNKIPTINQVAQAVGVERAEMFLSQIVARRKFLNILHSYNSPCHYCGAESNLEKFDFGLMRVKSTDRAWGETVAGTVLAGLTIPILGSAVVKFPSHTSQGEVLAMRLVVCKTCRSKEGNIFGVFHIDENRASRHPLWQKLQEVGFNKYLATEDVPLQFRMAIDSEP